jgi:Ca2+-binding RTX toxin-like protein
MQISISRHGRRLVMSTCAVAALAAASPPAQAAPVLSDLRVEAGGVVVTDSRFPTDTQSLTTDTGKPLGLLGSGSSVDRDLRPVRISDRFSFGLLVCGVGAYPATDSGFWLYKVDHVSPEVGGDAFKLAGGEQVLWFFQDSARKRNTGDELVVEAPARARPGEVEVTVSSYAFNGARKPAAGARVFFGDTTAVLADANGKARARVTQSTSVRAGRGGDIPSAPARVCVAADLDDCPSARGRRIYGSDRADRLAGTPGDDVVRAGAGNDTIDVRGGNDDRVRCGRGARDRVRANGGDRVTTDCEFVNGRRLASTRG